MPRRERCLLPDVPCHITQRGVDRTTTFSRDEDRETYLRLLRENLEDAAVRVWGWCLMSNHVHLILLPGRKDSVSVLMRRVHGRYAQYYNVRWGRTGHLWQNRFTGCMLGPAHLWRALAYVDRIRCGRGRWRRPRSIAGPVREPTSLGRMAILFWTWSGGSGNGDCGGWIGNAFCTKRTWRERQRWKASPHRVRARV